MYRVWHQQYWSEMSLYRAIFSSIHYIYQYIELSSSTSITFINKMQSINALLTRIYVPRKDNVTGLSEHAILWYVKIRRQIFIFIVLTYSLLIDKLLIACIRRRWFWNLYNIYLVRIMIIVYIKKNTKRKNKKFYQIYTTKWLKWMTHFS